ncbi:hypothetical protein A3Q56_04537, partial [Intoshia linei]
MNYIKSTNFIKIGKRFKSSSNFNWNLNSLVENKNPRNLELMNLAVKSKGWDLNMNRKEYYIKVCLDVTNRNVTANCVHRWRGSLLTVSTKDTDISKNLK